MSRLLKMAGIPMLAIGLAFLSGGAQADAGGFSISIGNYGYRGYPGNVPSIYYGRSYRPSYNYSRVYGHSQSFGGYYHPRQPHYDYHPPTLIPHGNHLDYVPGHYDLHHRGHIHH
ncbi:MAG: hypothetical protein KDB00_03990 [Planctomycetales bacterium]|nr:hypothetical protein [Planctomycetales bacterium]